jgi:hypothetical protein
MFRRPTRVTFVLAALGLLLPAALSAATFKGRPIDDHWFDGHAVNTTYGAYDCRIQFHGDRVFLQMGGVQVVGILDDEVLTDPHEIIAHDPRRGVDWTVDCYNLGN